MELALAHPDHGYYMTRDPFGAGGDFTTSPEISQIFGELIGAWLAGAWLSTGSPSPALLAECGPGRGTLMRDILRATARVPGFHESLQVALIETSPVLEAVQRRTLQGAHPSLRWLRRVEELPSLPLFLAANEFFDALPIRQFFASGEERHVILSDGCLAFSEGEVTREIGEPASAIANQIASHIAHHGGAALVVDYGYAEGGGDTLQAVKNHAFTDPLEAPGEADLTAHVDFGALADASRHGGGAAHGPVPQGVFLRRLGAELRAAHLCKNASEKDCHAILSGLERLVSPAQMGELFKVMAFTPPCSPLPEGF